MELPEGFFHHERSQNRVLKLKKALYGLKQSGRIWNNLLDSYLKSLGFVQCELDYCLYQKEHMGNVIMVLVYVDDILAFGSNETTLDKFRNDMKTRFKMKDMGKPKYVLGIKVEHQHEGSIKLSQPLYIKDILERSQLADTKSKSTPMEAKLSLEKSEIGKQADSKTMSDYRSHVGMLMYAAVCTRPDIAFPMSQVSKFVANPSSDHIAASKRIFQYLKGTENYGLVYSKEDSPLKLIVYCDADYAGDRDDAKSTSGFCVSLAGAAISWKSQKQQTVALSSTESEYMALTEVTKDIMWVHGVLEFLGVTINMPTIVYEDNQAAIKLSQNPVNHQRMKHVHTKFHFTRNKVKEGIISLTYVPTDEMVADTLTKSLAAPSFTRFRNSMGVRP